MPENLISLQQYAIKHKLSTFATVKLVNQGKIKTIKKIKTAIMPVAKRIKP